MYKRMKDKKSFFNNVFQLSEQEKDKKVFIQQNKTCNMQFYPRWS